MAGSPAVSGIADFSLARVMLYQGQNQPPANVPASVFIQDLSGYQPLDSDLTAIAAQTGTGIEARTGSGTFALRTLTGTANQIAVSNGDGVSGDPTFSLSVGSLLTGSWIPTATAVSNVTSATPSTSWYIRVGDKVFCGGAVSVAFTAGGNATTDWRMSLPVASNFSAASQASGSGATNGGVWNPLAIYADATNDTFLFRTFSAGAVTREFNWTAIYTII